MRCTLKMVKSLLEKNKKRTVKSCAQVEALEKFYSEHKYPSEAMKLLIESIGLTEKQVSGWFCHRRLKDKKSLRGESHASLRQDRLSGVIQNRGSGHRQDSCGSTKQGIIILRFKILQSGDSLFILIVFNFPLLCELLLDNYHIGEDARDSLEFSYVRQIPKSHKFSEGFYLRKNQ